MELKNTEELFLHFHFTLCGDNFMYTTALTNSSHVGHIMRHKSSALETEYTNLLATPEPEQKTTT
jgi:hypothetical protein